MAESQLNSSSSSSSWRRVSSHPSSSSLDRDSFFERDRPRSAYHSRARENADQYRGRDKMSDSRDKAAGSSRLSDRIRVPSEKSRPSASSSDESLGRSPQDNNSSEKEPGELSSGSVPEDSNPGAEEVKSYRVSSSSSKQEDIISEKEVTHENSSSPVQKKRKFTPIVWDLDDKPSQQKGSSALVTTVPKKSTTVKLQSRLQLATVVAATPLPVPSSPPHPPPPSLSYPKQQAPYHRSSLVTNVTRETPPKSSSRTSFTPPNNAPQGSVAKALPLSGSISESKTSGPVMVTPRTAHTPSPPPNNAQVSPMHVEDSAGRGQEDAPKGNDVSISSRTPDDSERYIAMEHKDVDMDMGPAPSINIATSRWAEDSTPPWDEKLSSGTGKEKIHQTSSDDGGNLSTDEERGKDVSEDGMSPEPGEYIRDKSESGDASGINAMKEYDAQMADQYERDLNNRELMELDKESDQDIEEEEHPEDDSEEEEEEASAILAQPQRAIDMLQGCRSVDEFERLNKIDEGTYGVVYRARDKKTGEIVALKKVKMEKEREGFPMTSLREINVLLSIHHPSIVDVKEVVVGSNLDSIFMVMEYMEHDLKGLMETIKQPFSQSEVKCLMLQLFEGVKHLHDNWVLHRDLKTSNLLLNNRGELKICDFGLARQYGSPLKTYTHMVVTLWYRAPELLLGCKQYSTAVDMWSLGCIMAEFLAKEPLFNGKNELDQLDKIFKTLGTPNETIWPDFPKLPGVKCNFIKQPFNKLREKFPPTAFAGRPPLSESGFNLLNRLLLYDPKKRITAEEALNHDWFKEVPLPKMKELMPTYPARSEQERRSRRLMKSPDPLIEQRKRELRQAELGSGGLFG